MYMRHIGTALWNHKLKAAALIVFALYAFQLALFSLPHANATTTVDTITSTGSWTAPANVSSVNVVCVGAGCGGVDGTTNGGGGGGLVYKNNLSVTPGASYSVVIGTGSQYANGGNSSFNTTIIAYGGTAGGAGGSYSGGDGGGNGGSQGQGGGGGAGGYTGNGGAGGKPGTDGSGGGGGGGDGPATWSGHG